VREVVALEQQRGRQALGEGIGCAIGQIQPCFRVNALAVSAEGFRGRTRLVLIEGRDFDAAVIKVSPEPRCRVRAVPATQNNGGLVYIHGRHHEAFGCLDRVGEGGRILFIIEDRDDSRRVNDHSLISHLHIAYYERQKQATVLRGVTHCQGATAACRPSGPFFSGEAAER
jgi:hypothetical protein